MKAILAEEIEQRGLAAVDELIDKGDLCIVRNDRPQYVILSEERYAELIEAEEEAYVARVRAALDDMNQGKFQRFDSAEELLETLDGADQP